jgi:hypothetical protein
MVMTALMVLPEQLAQAAMQALLVQQVQPVWLVQLEQLVQQDHKEQQV